MARYDVTSKAKGERGFAHAAGFATIQPCETAEGLDLSEPQVKALMVTREFVLSAVAEPQAIAKTKKA
jgi:hypothetical protein